MHDKQIYDLLIIGGGLVGASLATCLRTLPLKIALVESTAWFTHEERSPSYDDKTLALAYSSQRILSGMGLWEAIVPHVVPIKRIHVSDRGHFGFVRLDHQTFGLPALGYITRASQLGNIFPPILLQQSNLDIFAPAQLQRLHFTKAQAEGEIAFQGHIHSLSARLVIAADGKYSKVCQQVNMPTVNYDYRQTAIIANITLERPHHQTAYERFTTTGPLALLPLTERDCSCIWTVPNEQVDYLMALENRAFLALLQQQFGWRLGRFLQVGTRQTYPLNLIRTQRLIYPRLAVIGNAAHTLHPVAGQGLNLGLRDVATLAEIIANAYRENKDIGEIEILQPYAHRQQFDQQRVVTITDALVRIFSNALPPLVIARNAGLLFTDLLLPLKKQFIYQMTGLKGHPSRLLRGLPL